MKVITFLHNASLIATALLTLVLPGCNKEDAITPAPSDTTNTAQPEPEQILDVQYAQNDAPPLEEPKDQQANADQDLQMLKTATDNDPARDMLAAVYGPPEVPQAEPKPDAENTSDTENSSDKAPPKPKKRGLLELVENAKLADGLDVNHLDEIDWSSFDPEKEWSNPQAYYGPSFNSNTPRPYINPGIQVKHEPTPEPKIKFYSPEVTGSLDKRIIAMIVRKQHRTQLQACYKQELSKTKDLEGKVTITWIINKNGLISSPVKLKESTLNNKNMESCLIKAVKTWVFPASKDGNMTSVEFPIEFKLPKS